MGKLMSYATFRDSRVTGATNAPLLGSGVKGFIKAITFTTSVAGDAARFGRASEPGTAAPVRPYWLLSQELQVAGTVFGGAVHVVFPGRGLPFDDGLQWWHTSGNGSMSILVEVTDGRAKWLLDPET